MDAYRQCVCDYDLNNEFTLENEMKVLRDFCESQEQFVEVLEVYDDGRYSWCDKKQKVIDNQNFFQSDSDSDSDNLIVCDICKGSFDDEHIIGCCNKGNCKIENMCRDCAVFDEDIDEYICGNC